MKRQEPRMETERLQYLDDFCLIFLLLHEEMMLEFVSNYPCQIISVKTEASEANRVSPSYRTTWGNC